MAERKFLDFLDRIDGGGMGQSGDTFEGGGLLSMLGNLFASPYGSEDPERRARRDAFYAGQMGGELMTSAAPQVMPAQYNYTADVFEPNYADRFGVPAPAAPMQYGPPARSLVGPQLRAALNPTREEVLPAPAPAAAGPSINPANAYGPAAMTFQDFVAGLGPIAQTASPEDLMTAYRQHMMGY